MPIKMDRKALLWGAIIGLVLVVYGFVRGFEFGIRVPASSSWTSTILLTGLAAYILISSYRVLWSKAGFWLLVLPLLLINGAVDWFVSPPIVGGIGMYAIHAAVFVGIFYVLGTIVYRRYSVRPDVSAWLGLRRT